MAGFQVNFSDVESFDLIPEGKYPAIVLEASIAENNAGDGHNIVWEWQINVEGVDRKMRSWTSLKPTALWRAKKIFQSLGIYQDEMQFEVDEETGYILEPSLVGLAAVVQIAHGKYNNEMRANISEILSADADLSTDSIVGKSKSSTPSSKPKARLV